MYGVQSGTAPVNCTRDAMPSDRASARSGCISGPSPTTVSVTGRSSSSATLCSASAMFFCGTSLPTAHR